jgi:hypothetical protein
VDLFQIIVFLKLVKLVTQLVIYYMCDIHNVTPIKVWQKLNGEGNLMVKKMTFK